MAETSDPLKGYRGRARARLQEWGVRVWSEVRIRNDEDSTFEGVILPRSETSDDLHVVLKLATGYNVGLHIDRIREVEELGFKEAVYKIPEQEFPHSMVLTDSRISDQAHRPFCTGQKWYCPKTTSETWPVNFLKNFQLQAIHQSQQ